MDRNYLEQQLVFFQRRQNILHILCIVFAFLTIFIGFLYWSVSLVSIICIMRGVNFPVVLFKKAAFIFGLAGNGCCIIAVIFHIIRIIIAKSFKKKMHELIQENDG